MQDTKKKETWADQDHAGYIRPIDDLNEDKISLNTERSSGTNPFVITSVKWLASGKDDDDDDDDDGDDRDGDGDDDDDDYDDGGGGGDGDDDDDDDDTIIQYNTI